MVPALAMEAPRRPAIPPELMRGAAIEGTVFPTMTETDGSASPTTVDGKDSDAAAGRDRR